MWAMERWRQSWRELWEPLLSDQELEALADGLAWNDARIMPRKTVRPYEGISFEVNASQACPICYAIWMAR